MIDYIDTSQLPRDQNTTAVIFRNRKDIKFRADFLVSIIVSYKYSHVANYVLSLGNIYHKFQGNTTFTGYGLPTMCADEVCIDFDTPPASCIITIRRTDHRELLQVACRYPLRFTIGVRYWTCCEGRYLFTDAADQCKSSFINIFAMRKTTQRYRTLNLLELKFVQMYNILKHKLNPDGTMPCDDLLVIKQCTLPKILAPLPTCIKFGSNCVCVHDGEEHIADQWLKQLQHPHMPKLAPWESFHVKTHIIASRADQIQKHIERVSAFRAICRMSSGTSSVVVGGIVDNDIGTMLTSRNIEIIGKSMPNIEQSPAKYPEFHFAPRKNSRALVKLPTCTVNMSNIINITAANKHTTHLVQIQPRYSRQLRIVGKTPIISAKPQQYTQYKQHQLSRQLRQNITQLPNNQIPTLIHFPQTSRRSLVYLQKR